jgi:hypothetical protein
MMHGALRRCRLQRQVPDPDPPAEAAPGQAGGGQAHRGWRQRLTGRRHDGSVPARWNQGPARQRGRRCQSSLRDPLAVTAGSSSGTILGVDRRVMCFHGPPAGALLMGRMVALATSSRSATRRMDLVLGLVGWSSIRLAVFGVRPGLVPDAALSLGFTSGSVSDRLPFTSAAVAGYVQLALACRL